MANAPAQAPALSTRSTRFGLFLAVAAAAGLAAFTGMSTESGSKAFLVLPLAAASGVALGVLALTRFRLYVMFMLVARASLDLAKLSGGAAGDGDLAARALDPTGILGVVFLLASGLWLAAQLRREGRLPGSPLRRALGVFMAAALLSIIGSANVVPSVLEAIRILAAVMMFVVLEQMMADSTTTHRMLLAVYLSLVFPLLFTLGGFVAGSPPSEVQGSYIRLRGPFGQSNTFGRYLMVMVVFAAGIYPYVGRVYRRLLLVVFGLGGLFLVLTYTRSAIIGAFLGLIVVGLLQNRRLVGSLLVVAVAVVIWVPQLGERFAELTEAPSTLEGNAGNSLAWRVAYWREVLPLIQENPISGIGLGQTPYRTSQAAQPHNDFVRALVETGIVGLLAYGAMLAALLALGWKAYRVAPRGTLDRGIGVGAFACAVVFVAVSLVANVMTNVVTLWYFLAFSAAASGVVRRHREPPAALRPVAALEPSRS